MSAASGDPVSVVSVPVSSDMVDGSAHASTGHREGDNPQTQERRPVKKSTRVCRYYATKSGCRAGDGCKFRHVSKQTDNGRGGVAGDTSQSTVTTVEEKRPSPVLQQHAQASPAQRYPARPDRQPVSKPISVAQRANPREFQINQVVRRFAPVRENEADGSTKLSLALPPSDPDFPFELNALRCTLVVPANYPAKDSRPTLLVDNDEIPKGFSINVEKGFNTLVQPNKTLLALLNDLDRHLERFLSSEKAQTIKIVANRGKPVDSTKISTEPLDSAPPFDESSASAVASSDFAKAPPVWTPQQKAEAKGKREADVRQLEARMGRVPLFSTSRDGLTFNVPISYPKVTRLPQALRSLKAATLAVPKLYNLEPCTIRLKGVTGTEADNVEMAFAQYAASHKDSTLMAHINYLTQHLPEMAVSSSSPTPIREATTSDLASVPMATKPVEDQEQVVDPVGVHVDHERPHLVFLSKPPPEWTKSTADGGGSASDTSESYESEDGGVQSNTDEEADEGEEGGAVIQTSIVASTAEKGILLSFPQLEMTGIELLEICQLSLTVKCDRCKEGFEFKNIKPANTKASIATSVTRTGSCNKCASPLSVSYRAEPVHANSVKAGHIDLEGCTIIDMLPSNFLPTCSECSTTYPAPGVIAVRGDTSLAICRECHSKMTFKILETKFLRVATNDPRINRALLPKRKPKENLGITTGTELPERGRCKHYSKSYRWFRFSCCNRVYPCDRCHDEAESHPNEHANRMICGWCSREQNYRPEDCGACQRSVIRKTGGGFWEGGKGTRDKLKMSRKDPRKFKRIGGGRATNAPASSSAGEKKSK